MQGRRREEAVYRGNGPARLREETAPPVGDGRVDRKDAVLEPGGQLRLEPQAQLLSAGSGAPAAERMIPAG